ncbi:MAG: T9SS type A sorting domain-containing protein [Saprospiraceae bacterium]|nr:T9SS type A sorting domain-containing protein [Saprospiraceae bacterium]MCF8251618.1 T9SS type A sorting domain-containing protein [Saprospiraceae bacterium]MCF8281339.1 T9SS type A sorting domain-containing protein [Bacteroidales bacterium]MCF8312292.1 T9SS type A sorting domain-containing protein [Saprospiraceae bacterium]MCF8442000.1 T9SS type A sorting domain-containing protein [Saprospiraceae bacterium]
MKKLLTIVLLACLAFSAERANAQRYLTPQFTNVDVQPNVPYGQNWTVLSMPVTGHTTKQPLVMDIYSPTGDTETNRPLILYFRTGNFLPNPNNGGTTGTRNDSIAVELCTRLAKLGYVVANVDYRLGWNPLSTEIDVRISTLINAAYRGVQDARSCIRFFRKSVVENSNPYGICPSKITVFGEGTGGYISLATATLDQYSDIVLPKFIGADINGDGIPDPFVIEQIHGDLNGETLTTLSPANGDTLAVPNNPGYNSHAQLCVNLGGALGDISWLDASDPPAISFHVPDDPNAPYTSGILIVPTTGDQIVEVQGSYEVAKKSNQLGVNQVFVDANIQDGFTTAANNFNDGYEGLFPFNRPTWTNPLNPAGPPLHEGAPWQWWNVAYWSAIPHPSCPAGLPVTVCNFHVLNWMSQQDMSATKGRTYADSIIGYFAPRAYVALDLASNTCVSSVKDKYNTANINLTVFPNPANEEVNFISESKEKILGFELYDMSGRLLKSQSDINSNYYTMKREKLPTGIFIAKLRFKEGLLSRKIVLQ